MLALWGVEHLDTVEQVLPCRVACGVCVAADAFPFQQLEQALGDCVIMAIPSSAHAGIQIVLAEKQLPLAAGKLRALIGMDHHLGLVFATPDGGQQRLQCEVRRHPRLGRPSDKRHLEKIDGDGKIASTLLGCDVGDVGHPDLFWRTNLKLPIQPIVCDHRRLATISARTAHVSNLCGNTRQVGQTDHAVLRACLALIAQIVVQLAIALDLAAVGPCLLDQLQLPRILVRTLA